MGELSTTILVLVAESTACADGYAKLARALQKRISKFTKCWVVILRSVSLELSQSEDEFVKEIELASNHVDMLKDKLENMGADVKVLQSGQFEMWCLLGMVLVG